MKQTSQIPVFIFVVALISLACGQEETQCAGEEVKMSEHQKAQITECLTEVGIKTVWKIPAEKLACFGVCILEKKAMLTPEGKINHEKALKYIEMTMPDKVKHKLIDGIDKCIKEHGADVRTKDDPGCMSFLHVGQCTHDVFLDICVE